MTTYSLSDLGTQALREVGLYAPDEAVDPNDQEDAETKALSLIDMLQSRGISMQNGSAQAIPQDWYTVLAQYVGIYLLQSYGGPALTLAQVSAYETTLRELSAKPATGSILEVEYI